MEAVDSETAEALEAMEDHLALVVQALEATGARLEAPLALEAMEACLALVVLEALLALEVTGALVLVEVA